MRLEQVEGVHVLTMPPDEQVLNETTVTAMAAALEEVTAHDGPTALVLTGEGKSFNQGLDLPWLGTIGDGFVPFIRSVHALFGRFYQLDVPVIAAVNGHAIAGGAMLAQCADVRIMRADRGWFRLPEVELNLPFTTVMDALLAARLPQPVQHRLMVLGEQMGGADAAAAGVVDQAVDGEHGPLEAAMATAVQVARHRGPALRTIRQVRYRALLDTIEADADREDLYAP